MSRYPVVVFDLDGTLLRGTTTALSRAGVTLIGSATRSPRGPPYSPLPLSMFGRATPSIVYADGAGLYFDLRHLQGRGAVSA